MNRHVHADKIIAIAENVDLVVLSRFNDLDWIESNVDWCDSFSFLSEYEYFLCLEEHKEACLHWLNGGEGEVEVHHDNRWLNIAIYDVEWTPDSFFMNSKASIRIKPKKEKRWVLVNVIDGMEPAIYEDEDEAERILQGSHPNWTKHEIEVEV